MILVARQRDHGELLLHQGERFHDISNQPSTAKPLINILLLQLGLQDHEQHLEVEHEDRHVESEAGQERVLYNVKTWTKVRGSNLLYQTRA